jgi:hypothetical protein
MDPWITWGLRTSGLYSKQPVKRRQSPVRKMDNRNAGAHEEIKPDARADEKKVYDFGTKLEIIPPPEGR